MKNFQVLPKKLFAKKGRPAWNSGWYDDGEWINAGKGIDGDSSRQLVLNIELIDVINMWARAGYWENILLEKMLCVNAEFFAADLLEYVL